MARRYTLEAEGTNGTAQTLLTLIASATTRPRLNDILLGSDATPADAAMDLLVRRFTAAGTTAATPPTPRPLDFDEVAAIATAGHNHSAEPTYSTNLARIQWNQRASPRWVAQPGYDFIVPATAANGIGLQSVAATAAFNVGSTIFFEE